MRREHPVWGGRKIRRVLQDRGRRDVPAASTITAILHRHGCIEPAESHKHTKLDSRNAAWDLPVKADGEVTLIYTVDYTW